MLSYRTSVPRQCRRILWWTWIVDHRALNPGQSTVLVADQLMYSIFPDALVCVCVGGGGNKLVLTMYRYLNLMNWSWLHKFCSWTTWAYLLFQIHSRVACWIWWASFHKFNLIDKYRSHEQRNQNIYGHAWWAENSHLTVQLFETALMMILRLSSRSIMTIRSQ